MPRARRPALPSAEMSLRGKGAAACLCRPQPFQVGVFLCVRLPVPCGTALLPPRWGKRRGGSQSWCLPSWCLPLSSIPSPQRRTMCTGVLDRVQAHQDTREQSHGLPPVVGVWAQRSAWRRTRAALWAPSGSAMRRLWPAPRVTGLSPPGRCPARDGVAVRPRASGAQRQHQARGR